MPEFVQAKDFFESLKPTERVYLLIRHSIRRHITPQDSDNGAHVGLTDEGRALAISFGRLFPAGDAVYFSSPVGRCIDTAKCIAEGRAMSSVARGAALSETPAESSARGAALSATPANSSVRVAALSETPAESSARGIALSETPAACPAALLNSRADVPVETDEALGSFYVKDYDAYLSVLNERFYQNICAWLDSDNHPAFYPLAERAEELRQYMFQKGTARFNIFSTHDAWVVPTLVHFLGFHFTPSQWMNYLTGIAFVVDESCGLTGEGREHLDSDCGRTGEGCERIDKSHERVVALTGMDSGYLYFG